MDCSPPGSSVRGISQARILDWVAISSSRDLPHSRIMPVSPALVGGFFTTEPPWEVPRSKILKDFINILNFFQHSTICSGLPRWLSSKESTWQCRRCRFDPWVRKIPWRRTWQPNPVFLPGKSHEQRRLAGYSLWGHKESDMTE